VSIGLASLAADGGVIRRDAWDDYFAAVVSPMGLGLGIPIVPLDGLTLREFPSFPSPLKVAFTTKNFKTGNKQTVFTSGDEAEVTVKNESKRTIYIELIGTGVRGEKVIITPTPEKLEPGKTYKSAKFTVKARLGKEEITLFASYNEFPAGEVLQLRKQDYYNRAYYDYVKDRVIHRYYDYQKVGDRYTRRTFDPAELVKRTIDVETK
jgi:serine/threonine-protein kinase